MTKEFNNQHHQHQGTYRGWCAWLNANSIPSYMIESGGNFAILKTIKSVEFWMGSKILLFAYGVRWGWKLGTTLKHLESINGYVKILSKMIENER